MNQITGLVLVITFIAYMKGIMRNTVKSSLSCRGSGTDATTKDSSDDQAELM